MIIAGTALMASIAVACVSAGPSAALPSPRAPEAPLPPAVTTSLVATVPASFDQTGTTDVGAELQAFLDSVPDDHRIVFPSDAVYRIKGAIRLDGRSGLTLDGNGTTIRLPGCQDANAGFWIGSQEYSSDLIIRGFTIVGENEDGGTPEAYKHKCESQHAIALLGASRVTVEDVHIARINGDCLYVGNGRDGSWSTDVTFRDSSCVDNGRQAVAIVGGERVLVERIEMDRLAMHVLDIEPNDGSGGARDVVFAENVIGSYAHSPAFPGFFFGANGSLDAPVERVVVRDNLVTGGSLKSLVGDEFTGYSGQRTRKDIVVTDNRSEVPSEGPVLVFKNADNVIVTGNVQPLTDGPLTRFINSAGVNSQ